METIHEQQHSIKLTKGMTGNYSWEIKLYFDDTRSPYKVIEEISKSDKKMIETFKDKEKNEPKKI